MDHREQIQRELAKAEVALRDGNEGMVRVCARRAVGLAVKAWLDRFPRKDWCGDAMGQLRQIQQEESFPPEVRHAAERLITKVTERNTAPFTTDPIADARTITTHLFALTYGESP